MRPLESLSDRRNSPRKHFLFSDFVDIFTERTLVGWNLALDGCRLHFSLKTPLATTKAIRTTSAAHVVGPVKRKIRTNLQKDKLGVWSFAKSIPNMLRVASN
jgi:hypothetical protein